MENKVAFKKKSLMSSGVILGLTNFNYFLHIKFLFFKF